MLFNEHAPAILQFVPVQEAVLVERAYSCMLELLDTTEKPSIRKLTTYIDVEQDVVTNDVLLVLLTARAVKVKKDVAVEHWL